MSSTGQSIIKVGYSAHIDPPSQTHGGYDLFVVGDTLTIINGDGSGEPRQFAMQRFDDWVHQPPERMIAVGWGQLPDDREVIFLYDKTDDNYGYAVNLGAPDDSAWCYAPFDVDTTVMPRTRGGKEPHTSG